MLRDFHNAVAGAVLGIAERGKSRLTPCLRHQWIRSGSYFRGSMFLKGEILMGSHQ